VRRAGRAIAAFYRKAYQENVTGLSGMVAYNLLLSVFPLALLALFVASRVLRSPELQESIFRDLQRLFPTATENTITDVLDRVRQSSASIGVIALVTSIWFGSSFWGALDTAFCRIYHLECRSWLRQKRFALAMLGVVLLFMAATVVVPAAQSVLVKGTEDLPFGLSDLRILVYAIGLSASLGLLFLVLCVIYWTVPKGHVPWRAIWPGAFGATIAIGIVDLGFPLYLDNISTLRIGTSAVFVLIALVWFYVIALIILAGAVVNELRFEHLAKDA